MEERLQKALSFSKYRQTLNSQLQALKIQVETELTVSVNGGIFNVTTDFICFLDLLIRKGQTEVTLLDKNNTPVKIDNITDFFDDVLSKYFEITNDYLVEYERIRKSRSVSKIIDIETEDE